MTVKNGFDHVVMSGMSKEARLHSHSPLRSDVQRERECVCEGNLPAAVTLLHSFVTLYEDRLFDGSHLRSCTAGTLWGRRI